MNAFAKKFRQIRVELEITLREISKATGKSIAYLSDVEHARRLPPSSEIVAEIEKIFGITDKSLSSLAISVRETPKNFDYMMKNNPAVANLAQSMMRVENELGEEHLQSIIKEWQEKIDKEGE